MNVFYSHAASVALIAFLLDCSLGEAGMFAPTGVFKLRRTIAGGEDTGWVLERHGSDNTLSIPAGVGQEESTRPWGFMKKEDEPHGRDYEAMWRLAEELNGKPSLYHILPKATWEKDEAVYFPATYEADGFTHLSSFTSQLVDVGNRFYKGIGGEWVCLELDEGRLKGEVKMEPAAAVGDTPPEEGGQLYPHLYAGIRKDAVKRVLRVDRGEGGVFLGVEE